MREVATHWLGAELEPDGRRGYRDSAREPPRHQFVPAEERRIAYADQPLPIGFQQTISQPYVVALMTQLLQITGRETVIGVATRSGY